MTRDRRDWTEALGDVRIQFWTCLNDLHRGVTWTDDVARCDACGLTSEMTARFARAAVTYERERIIQLARKLGASYPVQMLPEPGTEGSIRHAWFPFGDYLADVPVERQGEGR